MQWLARGCCWMGSLRWRRLRSFVQVGFRPVGAHARSTCDAQVSSHSAAQPAAHMAAVPGGAACARHLSIGCRCCMPRHCPLPLAAALATAATWAITFHHKLWTRHRELLLFLLAAIDFTAYAGPIGESSHQCAAPAVRHAPCTMRCPSQAACSGALRLSAVPAAMPCRPLPACRSRQPPPTAQLHCPPPMEQL